MFNVAQESGFLLWCRGGSMLSPWGSRGKPQLFVVPMLYHRGLLWGTLTTWHRPAVPSLRPWCLVASLPRNQRKWGKPCSLQGETHGLWVEGPTILLLPVGPGVTRMLLLVNKPNKGLQVHWGSHVGCKRTLPSCHWVSGFSTGGCGGSSTFPHGSTCRGGSLDLVPLALIRIRWQMARLELWAWLLWWGWNSVGGLLHG